MKRTLNTKYHTCRYSDSGERSQNPKGSEPGPRQTYEGRQNVPLSLQHSPTDNPQGRQHPIRKSHRQVCQDESCLQDGTFKKVTTSKTSPSSDQADLGFHLEDETSRVGGLAYVGLVRVPSTRDEDDPLAASVALRCHRPVGPTRARPHLSG